MLKNIDSCPIYYEKSFIKCEQFIGRIKLKVFTGEEVIISNSREIYFGAHWRKYRIRINSEPIGTIPIPSDICIRANANYSEPIRKTFCNSYDEKR